MNGLPTAVDASGQASKIKGVTADVGMSVKNDVSAPLRSLKPAASLPAGTKRVIPLHPLPPIPAATGSAAASIPVQTRVGGEKVPTTSVNIDGMGVGFTGPQGTFTVQYAPPDTNGAVGLTQYVETVNVDLAVFNKTGTPIYGPVPINTVWSGFGGICQTNNDGDPEVVYDTQANRWVIMQFALDFSTPSFMICVAVSQTGDATGAYNRYAFADANFPDYPKLSVWPDGYYVTTNEFNAAGTQFLGAEVTALNRSSMLAGQPAATQRFTNAAYGGLLASTLDGATQPPVGAPNYVVGLGADTSHLAYWTFHVDWTTPANTTFVGPTALAVAPYTLLSCGSSCIPQPGTTDGLDSLGDRLMYRLAYRNFGDHQSLVVNNTVAVGGAAGVRWYELRVATPTTLSVFQQGTYAPADGEYRWMSSIAQDQSGNMALGFSESSTNLFPSVHFTGRLAGDTAGQMTLGEGSIITGGGSQLGTSNRWGDYSSMAIDPSNDCTFWYAQEYEATTGSFNWHTRLAAFTYPSCGSTIANDFSISASPSTVTGSPGGTAMATISTVVTRGNPQPVSLSVVGLPTGTTASFNPSAITSGASSTLRITIGASTAPGVYSLTISGAGSDVTRSTILGLDIANVGITNGGFEASGGTLNGWTAIGTTSVSSTIFHSGGHSAMLGSTVPTNGDSSISQIFQAPGSNGTLSFFYRVTCPDTVTFDWATATLADLTASTTITLLPRTCTNTGNWVSVSGPVTGGHVYTLTLTSHDDNYPSDPTYTNYDDVSLLSTGNPYNPVAPARLLDTRPGSQVGPYNTPFGANTPRSVQVTGLGGVPATGVSAVVLNVTVTDTSTASFLTVYPSCASSVPNASNLNWVGGVTIPNLVVATVGSDGKVCMDNAYGTTDVVVDVEGWYGTGGQTPPAGTYHALSPVRLLDTRPGSQVGPYNTPFGANAPRSVQVTGLGGVPASGVSAVVLNVTVTDTSTASFLTVYPSCASSVPNASNLNWVAGKTIPNRVMIPVGSDGNVCMDNAYGTTDVVVDVAGWYGNASSALGSQEVALAPCRVLDTRPGSQIGPYNTPFGAAVSRAVTVDGVCGVPASGVAAVVLNVTATDTSQASFFTVYPSGSVPNASDLNWVGGVTIPNLVLATVNASGQITIFNAYGTVDGVVDVVGYFQ
jgi:hypothetical protein